MSSESIITVRNLSKSYQIYDKPSDRLKQMVMRGRKRYYKEFWALKGVNFDIYPGETVGIIGENGCGKSTLLQLICGTLNPTEGFMRTSGRIAALLELGSGFNPEFTGRENVYMNASLLGLKNKEINERFTKIETFADIGNFIEQPVKSYSSGMMVRLAFAVAINVEPEILVIDEALAVGDERFQRKCFSKIEEIRDNGATILFVSHSAGAVMELCDRAILLDGGEKLAIGEPKTIIGKYQKLIYASPETKAAIREQILKGEGNKKNAPTKEEKRSLLFPTDSKEKQQKLPKILESYDPQLTPLSTVSYGANKAAIKHPTLQSMEGKKVNNIVRGRRYRYSYTVNFFEPAFHLNFGMMIKTTSGFELGGATSLANSGHYLKQISAGDSLRVEFEFLCNLNPGIYFLNSGVEGRVEKEAVFLHRLLDASMFRVVAEEGHPAAGPIDFNSSVTVSRATSPTK